MASLQSVQILSSTMLELEREQTAAEEALSALKERIRILKEESIPAEMQELGVESVTLSTGEKVSISQEVYASIPVANKHEAFSWLTENGFGGLIKTSVEAQFDRGEMDRANEIMNMLQQEGVGATLSQNVHSQTLKAFIKERLATDEPFPLDLFGARPVFTTKIKAAKRSST